MRRTRVKICGITRVADVGFAVAAGADGLLIEVHAHPEAALSDARQALSPEQFEHLMGSVERVARAVDREL